MSEKFKIEKKFEVPPKKKFEVVPKRHEISDETPLAEVEPIQEGGLAPNNREDLRRLVEAPLLEACQLLFDKHIETLMTSANKNDLLVGDAYIDIAFDILSPSNKDIALRLGTLGKNAGSVVRPRIKISIPVRETTTVGEIRRAAYDLVSQFEDQ